MKVCIYNDLTIAVLTRNEHCPPHVHVGTDKWDARFEFSFWHNSVRLWDVIPVQNEPSSKLLESLRRKIGQPKNLRRSRELWWISRQTICLKNKRWDLAASEVVDSKVTRSDAVTIEAEYFDEQRYRTRLKLKDTTDLLEIEL
jgi:hypothetical protein